MKISATSMLKVRNCQLCCTLVNPHHTSSMMDSTCTVFNYQVINGLSEIGVQQLNSLHMYDELWDGSLRDFAMKCGCHGNFTVAE